MITLFRLLRQYLLQHFMDAELIRRAISCDNCHQLPPISEISETEFRHLCMDLYTGFRNYKKDG